MTRSAALYLLCAWPALVMAQHRHPGSATGQANPVPGQPVVIVELPPPAVSGSGRPPARMQPPAPVSPGQDTYSSTGAVPASSHSQSHSSSGRVRDDGDCVRGGVVRKCN